MTRSNFFSRGLPIYLVALLGVVGLLGPFVVFPAGPESAFEIIAYSVITGIGLYSYLALLFLAAWQRKEMGFWAAGLLTVLLVSMAMMLGPYFALIVVNGLSFGFFYWGLLLY